ncbi:MAG: hypothetical protein RM049_27760 [Nostoc sp. DedQUE04]|uniref:hypothetical protein n=1 Tax=Nostoc sp. DedQUE04 TaxID=3075390 RepID=UPI002AD3C0E6|nr:hypothetical protein [Nostoc sp. DedQUE04]MDZ8139032.1 hypothetical protein [Nostoc sp. DedQUE04]
MGESKRRKLLDPNYGKPNFLTALDLFGNGRSSEEIVLSILSGQTILSCFRIEDESGVGGDAFIENDISEIIGDTAPSAAHLKTAYEIATQENMIKLGIRRQHEQGKGLLSLMDAKYRQLIGFHVEKKPKEVKPEVVDAVSS